MNISLTNENAIRVVYRNYANSATYTLIKLQNKKLSYFCDFALGALALLLRNYSHDFIRVFWENFLFSLI